MKLIIFDFEGTLVDFQWKLDEAITTIRKILEGYRINYNIPCNIEKFKKMDYARLYNYFSRNIKDKFLRKKIMSDFDRIYDYYDEDASLRWRMYNNVKEILEILKQKNYKLALDTNVGRKAINKMLRKFGIEYFFNVIITRDDVDFIKPNPEGIFKILDSLNQFDFKEKFFVGDSVTDIKTVKKANKGLKIISVTNGENKIEELLKQSPDHIVNNVFDVINII